VKNSEIHGATVARSSFQTTGPAGLDHESPPMRLYHKAKRLGVWDPRSIDLRADVEEWRTLTEPERDLLLRVTALFQAGEEGVTLDLLPLLLVVAREGRVEEELYLTTFLWEEAKHTEFFRRFLDEVVGATGDLHGLHQPSYRRIFYEDLPSAMNALLTDASPAAQARAAVTYNMIVEGVLAETGYHGYHEALTRRGVLPGLREGLGYVKRDESRHIAYGVYLLSRLVAEDESLWPAIEARMGELLEPALGVVTEMFALYDEMPFGLELDEFLDYARGQFAKRFARIEKARAVGVGAVDFEEE
jgi:ribonucleoside-diphosphate reductase beta chain